MLSGKGVRRFHTTGLAQLHRRAKGCATAGAPFIFIHVFPVCWKNMNENKLISDSQSEVLRGGSGEVPVGPARGREGVRDGIAGSRRPVIWQPPHTSSSASCWQPVTSIKNSTTDGCRSIPCKPRFPRAGWLSTEAKKDQGGPKRVTATPRPPWSPPEATLRLPWGYTQAYPEALRLPRSYGWATSIADLAAI